MSTCSSIYMLFSVRKVSTLLCNRGCVVVERRKIRISYPVTELYKHKVSGNRSRRTTVEIMFFFGGGKGSTGVYFKPLYIFLPFVDMAFYQSYSLFVCLIPLKYTGYIMRILPAMMSQPALG